MLLIAYLLNFDKHIYNKKSTYLFNVVCLVPFPRSLCFGLSCVPVGVDEDMVRSLAKELVEDSLEMLVMAERARRAAASGLPGLPTSSSASRPLPGASGGFSSTGTMYDSIAAYSFLLNLMNPYLIDASASNLYSHTAMISKLISKSVLTSLTTVFMTCSTLRRDLKDDYYDNNEVVWKSLLF